MAERGEGSLWSLFYKDTIPIHEGFTKVPPPTTTNLEGWVSTYEFWGTQSLTLVIYILSAKEAVFNLFKSLYQASEGLGYLWVWLLKKDISFFDPKMGAHKCSFSPLRPLLPPLLRSLFYEVQSSPLCFPNLVQVSLQQGWCYYLISWLQS